MTPRSRPRVPGEQSVLGLHLQAVSVSKPLTASLLCCCSERGPELRPVEGWVGAQPLRGQQEGRLRQGQQPT